MHKKLAYVCILRMTNAILHWELLFSFEVPVAILSSEWGFKI